MAGTCGYGEELSGSISVGSLTSGKVYWLASQEGLCFMERERGGGGCGRGREAVFCAFHMDSTLLHYDP